MNTLAWWYARRGGEPSAWVLAQLALVIVGLTAFLYFHGGYANPFASLFLLPLAVAATVYLAKSVDAGAVVRAFAAGEPLTTAPAPPPPSVRRVEWEHIQRVL